MNLWRRIGSWLDFKFTGYTPELGERYPMVNWDLYAWDCQTCQHSGGAHRWGGDFLRWHCRGDRIVTLPDPAGRLIRRWEGCSCSEYLPRHVVMQRADDEQRSD